MKKIVGVRFKKPGKIYFFDPGYLRLNQKQKVIVETSMGEDIGEVVINRRNVPDEKIVTPLKKIIRIATHKDLKHDADNKKKEKDAFTICEDKIKKYGLNMRLTDVEYKFDNSKVLFYFTADGRIDFRELVKELASIFKTRIELRQIGVRDEVKRIGGNGVCGRELCCCSFLDDFETVSIKMAKEQNISLNPSKISGNCGRLMCCLKYEHEVYEDKLKRLPKIGSTVKTVDGEGIVDSVEILKEMVRIKFKDEEDNYFYKKYSASDVKLLKSASIEDIDEEEKENLIELQKLEELDIQDSKNKSENNL